MPSPFPYFPFYCSDWLTDTASMSPQARGVYIQLLCFQWINGDLPTEEERLMRMAGCNEHEFANAWPEIQHKFQNQNGKLVNLRLESERKKTNSMRDKRRKSAEVRWGKDNDDEDLDANASASDNRSESYSESDNRSSKKESSDEDSSSPPSFALSGDQPKSRTRKKKANVPFEDIRALYNEICTDLPECKQLGTTRKGFVRSRWNNDLKDLDAWRKFFEYVHEKCPFLNGRVEGSSDRPSFRADFTWLVREGNFIKIKERKYEQR